MRKPDDLRRRREAGLMLMTACEEALGVRGPTALSKLTGHSKSWWSKLASGAAAFPTWEELNGWLPPGLAAAERDRLHLRYRQAWLCRYDPVLIERPAGSLPPHVRLPDLHALRNTAGVIAYHLGDHGTALRLTTVLELLLVPRGIESLPREELAILQDCLNLQSVCERELGNYDAAIAVAQRSVKYQQVGRSYTGELLSRHALGLTLQMADTRRRPGLLAKALKEFEGLRRECRRWGLEPDATRAQRDLGITWLLMGRKEESEAELQGAFQARQQSADSRFRTGLWLVKASLRGGDVEQARRWLARMRAMARSHPDEIAQVMAVQHIANDVTRLEQEVAAPRRPWKDRS